MAPTEPNEPLTPGQKLAKWRREAKKSQTECAADVDVRQPTWSEWEKDSKSPQIKYAIRIARLTGGAVPVESWAPGEEETEDHGSTPPPSEDATLDAGVTHVPVNGRLPTGMG